MTDNTRARHSTPGASAPRDGSQGETKRRRRRGRGKGRGGQQGQQGQHQQQSAAGSGAGHGSQDGGSGGSNDTAKGGSKDGTAKAGSPQRKRRRGGQGKNAGSNQAKGQGRGRGGQNRGGQANRSNNSRRGNRRRAGTDQHRRPQYPDRYDSSIPTRDETSAGGLVVSGMAEAVDAGGNVDLSQIYAALIGRLDRRGRLLWSMPKGHVENDEHQWKTAEREVWEETGIYGEAFDTLGTIDYWFVSDGVRIHKTVHHNLLRYVDGELNDEDPEVTEVAWVPLSELIERLAYADERKLARIAVDRMPDLARKELGAGRATPR